jgi:oxygen-dependent protoporphyrinogen oxidase
VAAIERFEEGVPGLYISGNFRGGVSISDCVRQAHDMAERVSTRLGISS